MDRRAEQALRGIEDILGLDRARIFRPPRGQQTNAMRRTTLAIYVLFGSYAGPGGRRGPQTTLPDEAAVNAFMQRAGGPSFFGMANKAELLRMRDMLLAVRRAYNASASDAERGMVATRMIGPLLEKFVFFHKGFQASLTDLARSHVVTFNAIRGAGGAIVDVYGRPWQGQAPPLNENLIFTATNVRLLTPAGEKAFTDLLKVSFPGSPGKFVLADNLTQSISAFNETKAPSVVGESNYQHAEGIPRLAEAQMMIYEINGRTIRTDPSALMFAPAAINQVTTSLRGRFGGAAAPARTPAPDDWIHRIGYFVPEDGSSAQLRIIISVRQEALLDLLR